jgi:transcription-repair coupling factor (superfamily II helicase)
MVDPAAMMKLVSRNAKRGAQFTPQGVLRWPLSSAKADAVLSETRTLLESLSA